MAYWRFETGPDGAQVSHGGQGNGVFYPGVLDSSGHGNDLSVFAEGWAGYAYGTDLPSATIPQTGAANKYSVVNTGGSPAMWNHSLSTWSPSAWTIEAAFQPENGGYRTLVGRDSRGTAGVNGDLAALYLQTQPDNSLAIKYCDVSGNWHEAVSAPGLVPGYNWPNSGDGTWQAVAAVCDGTELSLYYKNIEGGDTSYRLVAQTSVSGLNTALTTGAGDGGDWDAGDFSVGRGLYAGGHGDRAYGSIDEVRISDTALTPNQFLFTVPEPGTIAMSLILLSGLGCYAGRRFWLRR